MSNENYSAKMLTRTFPIDKIESTDLSVTVFEHYGRPHDVRVFSKYSVFTKSELLCAPAALVRGTPITMYYPCHRRDLPVMAECNGAPVYCANTSESFTSWNEYWNSIDNVTLLLRKFGNNPIVAARLTAALEYLNVLVPRLMHYHKTVQAYHDCPLEDLCAKSKCMDDWHASQKGIIRDFLRQEKVLVKE